MKFTVTLELTPAQVISVAQLLGGEVAMTTTVTTPAKTKGKGKKAAVVEEEETEEEVESEEFSAEEETEDEPDFDADAEEEETEEEEEEAPAKSKGKAAEKSKAPAVTIETVITAFQATKKVLTKKLKSEEKANTKLNGLLKKHGSKSIKGLKPALLATVLKEVKALAA